MKILYKLFRQNPESRDGVVTVTSGLGIIVNILIAAVKVIVGAAVSSIAIISEGVNNATDAVTSVLALLGTKLSKKKPDEKHPFGYGRIEYITSLAISGLILFSGIELLISSVQLIFSPADLTISYITLIIIAFSGVVKLFLGLYTIKTGKRVGSGALVAVGKECRNDSFASLITIISAVIFLVFNLSVDAYAGILTSLIILKAGFEVLRETLSEILGRPGQTELAEKLYKEIRSTPGIINAVDMMLHNYGPEKYSGSVNIEIDESKSVGEVYDFIHDLQLRIMYEYHVTMVFGIYAVDNTSPETRELRRNIASYVRENEHILSYHAVYVDKKSNKLYCDFIVDYSLRDWDGVRKDFGKYMSELYPDKNVILTIETQFV